LMQELIPGSAFYRFCNTIIVRVFTWARTLNF
jgi:hypothetical protein